MHEWGSAVATRDEEVITLKQIEDDIQILNAQNLAQRHQEEHQQCSNSQYRAIDGVQCLVCKRQQRAGKSDESRIRGKVERGNVVGVHLQQQPGKCESHKAQSEHNITVLTLPATARLVPHTLQTARVTRQSKN
jgi:hypothetical protein